MARKERDYYTFVLDGQKESVLTNPRNNKKRRFPATWRPASSFLVIPKSGKYKDQEVEIRYLKGAESIYTKEQPEISGRSQRLRIPSFTNGFLTVSSKDKMLLEVLRSSPQNKRNHTDNGDYHVINGERGVFYEYDIEEIARKETKKELDLAKASVAASELDFRTRVLPICHLVGVDIDELSNDTTRYNLLRWVHKNPESFNSIIRNQTKLVDRSQALLEILEEGIIKRVGNSFRFVDSGKEVASFSMDKNPMREFVDWSYHEGAEQWSTIYRMYNEKKAKVLQSSVDTELQDNEELTELLALSPQELFDEAKSQKVIEWKVPYYIFGRKQLGKGEEETLRLINSEPSVKRDIALAVYQMNNK